MGLQKESEHMSLHGVELTAKRIGGSSISDAELERIFLSLESNAAIQSIDMIGDLEAGQISFMLGVDCPRGLDSSTLVPGIVEDAMAKALEGHDGSQFQQPELTLTPQFC